LFLAAAEPDNNEDKESYYSDINEEEEEEPIEEEELEGHEEDFKMPATRSRRKGKTPPRNRNTAPVEDKITILARGMTISEPTNE
jgi:hypothetical protein